LGGAMAIAPDHFSIKRIEFAYWAHESFGLSPVFRYLAERGKLELEDWSNYNMSARFKAGAMGLPFLPTRGPLGSDILEKCRAKVMDCPFTGTPIVLVPASHPNVGILHVQTADQYGNCIIRGTRWRPYHSKQNRPVVADIITLTKSISRRSMRLPSI
ncbi:MAG: hypothetical protein NTU74_13890, partial [Deltaproteobacteria bacterium]|nr:hypothetical protein [Deltaproteobacteria bacterium]